MTASLVQILLPLYDRDGRPIAPEHFRAVKHELTEAFGGLTCYSRAPAEGRWKEDAASVEHDDIVVFEVMTDELDREWWRGYRTKLEQRFAQESIVVRAQRIERL